jgi:hypothetical protein
MGRWSDHRRRQRSAIATLLERKTRLTLVVPPSHGHTAVLVADALNVSISTSRANRNADAIVQIVALRPLQIPASTGPLLRSIRRRWRFGRSSLPRVYRSPMG